MEFEDFPSRHFCGLRFHHSSVLLCVLGVLSRQLRFSSLNRNDSVGQGSAGLRCLAARQTLRSTIFDLTEWRGKKLVEQGFRRASENRTRAACAPMSQLHRPVNGCAATGDPVAALCLICFFQLKAFERTISGCPHRSSATGKRARHWPSRRRKRPGTSWSCNSARSGTARLRSKSA